MSSSKIVIKSLHEEVAQRIREMIRKGILNKGDRIVEKNLCATLGISRTPLREALRQLTSEGLVRVIPHRGAYVAEPSIREIREMFEVMSFLEGNCARMATVTMSHHDLEKLEKLHEKLEEYYLLRDAENYLEINHQFHCMLQDAAGNQILNEVINGLRDKILLYRHRQLYLPDRFDASMNEHRDLIDALRRRDAESAECVMRTHLMNQCRVLESLYKERIDESSCSHYMEGHGSGPTSE